MLGKVESKRRTGQQRLGWLDSITDSVDMNLSKLWEIVADRGAWQPGILACYSPWRSQNVKHNLMTSHSSILVWEIPWLEEPGGIQSMGSQRVGMTE